MSRKERRAAEHIARKTARQAGFPTLPPSTDDTITPNAVAPEVDTILDPQLAAAQPPEHSPISAARLAANRQNSLKSCGAKTPAGKAIVRLNAIRTGLTGVTVLLPGDDVIRYHTHISDYEKQFSPVGPEERAIVQSIADIRWRLNRIPALEQAIIATGYFDPDENGESPEIFESLDAIAREVQTRKRHEKELRNLQLQENRLARRRERELAELLRLQAARKANEEEALAEAAKEVLLARNRDQPAAAPAQLGFAFSKHRFDTYFARLNPAARQKLLSLALAEAAEAGEVEQTEVAAA